MTDFHVHDTRENRDISAYIAPGRRAHLIGIGGVSMSPLAEVLHRFGMVVTGSDMKESPAVEHLRSLGIQVAIGHRAENLGQAELVIRTAAAHDENPEIAAARRAGIPVFERAQAWGRIMRDYRNALCIAGTHGKTTTTSMCTHIAMAAAADPTVMIGGVLPLLGSGYRVGKGETIILESCEYCNSFLSFFPTVAVILNIEADHLDFFQDLADVERSFRAFALRVPENGVVIANADDANTMETLAGLDRPMMTFGLERGDVHAANLRCPASTTSKTPWPPPPRPSLWASTPRRSPRVWGPFWAPDAGLSTRGPTTGRRFMTITPITPASCGPSSRRWARWATGG